MSAVLDVQLFLEVFVTLFVIIDPVGSVPIFLSVTRSLDTGERNRASALAAVTALCVITVFALAGKRILDYLDVSIPAMQGAGGLLLLLVALQLLSGDESEPEPATPVDPADRLSIAMVPLGTPLLAGPGAIVATILFVERADGWTDWSSIAVGIVVVLLSVFLAMRFSGGLMRVLRPTGVLLVARIAGILLAAIAVQMVADSVISFAQQA